MGSYNELTAHPIPHYFVAPVGNTGLDNWMGEGGTHSRLKVSWVLVSNNSITDATALLRDASGGNQPWLRVSVKAGSTERTEGFTIPSKLDLQWVVAGSSVEITMAFPIEKDKPEQMSYNETSQYPRTIVADFTLAGNPHTLDEVVGTTKIAWVLLSNKSGGAETITVQNVGGGTRHLEADIPARSTVSVEGFTVQPPSGTSVEVNVTGDLTATIALPFLKDPNS